MMVDYIILLEIAGAALTYSFLIQLIYLKLIPQKQVKELNSQMKTMQKKVKEMKNPEEALKVQNKIMALSMKKFQLSSKAMIGTMALFFVVFEIFKRLFSGFILFSWSNKLPVIGYEMGWFLTFILISMPFNIILKKLLKVEI